MNCPNCKKDLVIGFDCDQCRDILTPKVEAPVIEESPIKKAVKRVKKVLKKK